jgi:hypothetical protein
MGAARIIFKGADRKYAYNLTFKPLKNNFTDSPDNGGSKHL